VTKCRLGYALETTPYWPAPHSRAHSRRVEITVCEKSLCSVFAYASDECDALASLQIRKRSGRQRAGISSLAHRLRPTLPDRRKPRRGSRDVAANIYLCQMGVGLSPTFDTDRNSTRSLRDEEQPRLPQDALPWFVSTHSSGGTIGAVPSQSRNSLRDTAPCLALVS
jgi:hypothetical protein